MEELILNNERYCLKSVVPLFPELEEKGVAKIQRIEIKDSRYDLNNLRAIRDGGWMFRVVDGHYMRLVVNKELVMSDTGMERLSNETFTLKANGHVLIAGLGIGLVIHNIINESRVSSITVIEKYQDVIDLVAPKFQSNKLNIICANIFDWKPDSGVKYDVQYFDIWSHVSTDNLKDISKLHNRFKFYLNRNNPDCWMNSWMKEFLQNEKRKENREIKDRNDFRRILGGEVENLMSKMSDIK